MSKLSAFYQVKPHWGYAVAIFEDDNEEPVVFYTAGNHVGDSQVYGAESHSRVPQKQLTQFAKDTLLELIAEMGLTKKDMAYFRRSSDLLHSESFPDKYSLNGVTWITYPVHVPTH